MSSERTAKILRPSEIPARVRGGGITTIPLATRKTGSDSFINGITIFPPRAAVPLHFHNCQESVVLLSGSAVAHIDGADHDVAIGDTTLIPAGVQHYFRNASDSEEMRILWIYASLDADRTIVATGENRKIDDEHEAPVAA